MYKKSTIASLSSLVLILALLPGCFWDTKKENTALESLKTGLFVVDVNSQKQYDDCHIKGAIHANLDELDALAQTLDKEKSDVIFYCSNYMCAASGSAAQKFVNLGFKSVAAYEGGIAEWHQKGLPVEGPAQESYLAIVMNKPAHKDETTSMIEAEALAQKMGQGLPSHEEVIEEEILD